MTTVHTSIRIPEQSYFINEKAAINDEIKINPEVSYLGSNFESTANFSLKKDYFRILIGRSELTFL